MFGETFSISAGRFKELGEGRGAELGRGFRAGAGVVEDAPGKGFRPALMKILLGVLERTGAGDMEWLEGAGLGRETCDGAGDCLGAGELRGKDDGARGKRGEAFVCAGAAGLGVVL